MTCRFCGCSDDRACNPPCGWATPTVCTSCIWYAPDAEQDGHWLCTECGGELALATAVCVDCGADPLGYFDDFDWIFDLGPREELTELGPTGREALG